MLGQIRVVDRRRERRRGILGLREGHRAPGPHPHLTRADLPAVTDVLGAVNGHRQHRRAGLEREPADPAVRDRERAAADPRPLGEDAERAAALEDPPGGLERLRVGLAAADRIGAEPAQDPALPGRLEQLDLGDVVHRPPPREHRPEHERVEEAAVVGDDDQAALDAGVLASEALEPEPDQEGGLEEDPGDDVEHPVDALRARVLVVAADPVGSDPLRGAGLRRLPRLLRDAAGSARTLACRSLVGHREAVPPLRRPVTGRPPGPALFWSGPAGVAQLAERVICNHEVTGSIPVSGLRPPALTAAKGPPRGAGRTRPSSTSARWRSRTGPSGAPRGRRDGSRPCA